MSDGFDYTFDLFTEEFPENQNTKIKTEEALKELSTQEDLSELDKAVHCLVKGYEIQKKSIIQNMKRYMREPKANSKLAPIIINSIDDWDMKFQIEGANALKEGGIDHLLVEEHCNKLMTMAGDYIKTNISTAVEDELSNEDSIYISYVNAWKELFIELNHSISGDGLKSEVVPTIKSLIDLKHKVAVRKGGVDLLVQSGLKHEEENILTYFKGLLLFCGRDLNWNIRLTIGEGIPQITQLLSKENCMDIFYEELVEFLDDVEILVRLNAIEAMLEIFPMLTIEQVQADFVPAIKQHLNLDIDDSGNSRMSKYIGKITFNLLNFEEMSTELNDTLLDYFKELLKIESADIVANVGYNLPCMYFIFNKGELDFVAILNKYAASKDPGVRLQIASCFHEVLGVCSMGK